MTSWEPDRVTFSRKTQAAVLFVAGCFLAVAALLYLGRPW